MLQYANFIAQILCLNEHFINLCVAGHTLPLFVPPCSSPHLVGHYVFSNVLPAGELRKFHRQRKNKETRFFPYCAMKRKKESHGPQRTRHLDERIKLKPVHCPSQVYPANKQQSPDYRSIWFNSISGYHV